MLKHRLGDPSKLDNYTAITLSSVGFSVIHKLCRLCICIIFAGNISTRQNPDKTVARYYARVRHSALMAVVCLSVCPSVCLSVHVSEWTYTVSSGTLNSTIPYHTVCLSRVRRKETDTSSHALEQKAGKAKQER